MTPGIFDPGGTPRNAGETELHLGDRGCVSAAADGTAAWATGGNVERGGVASQNGCK
jgi:hypothetical protein